MPKMIVLIGERGRDVSGEPKRGHTGGHTTLWSLSADLTARRLAYARGAPCAAAFEPVAWPT